MWRRDTSRTKNVWELERKLDADGTWLKETYGLEFANREFVRSTVERGETVPHERLREPAAAYAERVLQRSWWVRHGTARVSGPAFLVVASGPLVADVVSAVVGNPVLGEEWAVHGSFMLVTLSAVVNLQWLRSRRLRRAIRLNRTDAPSTDAP